MPTVDTTEAHAEATAEANSPRDYYRMGSKFLEDNAVLLGFHITEPGSAIGDLDDDVRSALNLLAIETARRMARIMRDDLEQAP